MPGSVAPSPTASTAPTGTEQPQPPAPGLSNAIDLLNQRLDQGEGGAQPPIPAIPGSSVLSDEEAAQIQAQNPTGEGDPEKGVQDLGEDAGIAGRLIGRLFGTDVDDPLPWTRMGTTMAGGIAGGIYGARIPGPPMAKAAGAFAGGLAGTVMGAAAPETTLQALEMTGILQPGERERLGLNNEELMTVLEGEAMLDAATFGGVSLARGLGRGITGLLTGANAGTRAIAEGASREGIALLPVQVGERTFARGFVAVMGRFPWVANGLKRRAQRAVNQISDAFDRIPGRLGPLSTFDETGGRILREAGDTATAISQHYTRQFDDLLARADMNGMQVRPVSTRSVTDSLTKQLDRAVPKGFDKTLGTASKNSPLEVPKMQKDFRRFLRNSVEKLYQGTGIADQSLRQMDTILQTIDEKMVSYAKSGDQVTMGRLERVRNAIMLDMNRNVVAKGGGNLSPAQREIATEFSRLDQELTEQVNFLFNSTSAQRMGASISPTTRSAIFQEQGMRGADSMAKALLRGDSPNAVAEIARLVQPETMQRLGNAYFTEAIEAARIPVENGVRQFDIATFQRQLGLNAPNSAKYRQTEAILHHAGGVSMDQLQQLAEITSRVAATEIPDVSTFVARQATFSGIRGAVRAALPFVSVGAAGTMGGGMGAGLVAAFATIVGVRGMAAMISNPVSARALGAVLDVEARDATRRAAYLRATGAAIGQMVHVGEWTVEEATQVEQSVRRVIVDVDRAAKNAQ